MRVEAEQEESDWAESEFGLAGPGNKRLTSRLVALARAACPRT